MEAFLGLVILVAVVWLFNANRSIKEARSISKKYGMELPPDLIGVNTAKTGAYLQVLDEAMRSKQCTLCGGLIGEDPTPYHKVDLNIHLHGACAQKVATPEGEAELKKVLEKREQG
jgi:hypothetical protein